VVLAVQEISVERQRLVAIDLLNRRVSARRALSGSVQALVRTDGDLVMLLAPVQEIGPARLAVANAQGTLRFVRLKQILAGSRLVGASSEPHAEARLPGLAIDSKRHRVFVVERNVTAEIDLKTLAVSYHNVRQRRSLLSRLWNWLDPTAAAKELIGQTRDARWLGGNSLAIAGIDAEGGQAKPAGLLIADTRTWHVRVLDRDATSFQVARELLLATGGTGDAETERGSGTGLTAYSFDGDTRFQLFEGQQAWLDLVYRGRAYVSMPGENEIRVVDLASGRVVASQHRPPPWLLLGSGSGWWPG
jgi:hypothetical protein